MPPGGAGAAPDNLLKIGWKEYVDFPEWGVQHIKAKVDTGARTSALDVARYELERRKEGLFARMELALNRRKPDRLITVETKVLRLVVVTSSNGVRAQRPVIETTLKVGPLEKKILLTVTDRSGLLIPVLLGREALTGSFLVDVNHKYLLSKPRGGHKPGA